MTDEISKILEEIEKIKSNVDHLRVETNSNTRSIEDLQEVFDRIDSLMKDYEESIHKLNRLIAIQNVNSKNSKERFIEKADNLEHGLDHGIETIMKNQESFKDEHNQRLDKIEEKITSLERNQWKFAGLAIALVVAISMYLNETNFFGFILSFIKGIG